MTSLKEAFPDPEQFTDEEVEPDFDPYAECDNGGTHNWRDLDSIERDDETVLRYCYRCKRFDARKIQDHVDAITKPYQEAQERNLARINELTRDVELQKELAAISKSYGDKAQADLNVLKQREAATAYSAHREALAHAATDQALNALSAICPMLDRAGFPVADVVAMYQELALKTHKFASSVRSANPAHPAWSQMDTLGVAGVLIRERNNFSEKLGTIYRLCGNPHEDLKVTLGEIRAMTRGAAEEDDGGDR